VFCQRNEPSRSRFPSRIELKRCGSLFAAIRQRSGLVLARCPTYCFVIPITANQRLNDHSQNRGLGLNCACGQEKCAADAGCGGPLGRGTGARVHDARPARRLLPPDDAQQADSCNMEAGQSCCQVRGFNLSVPLGGVSNPERSVTLVVMDAGRVVQLSASRGYCSTRTLEAALPPPLIGNSVLRI
jgi:hypothetical protein